MADFTGFYFNNIHSSTYGILRVSGGDMYEENILPEFDDNTINSVGGEGELYESRSIKTRTFDIDIAFDSVTEEQWHAMKLWLFTEEPKSLRFDERPYKSYWAKLKSSPSIDYICFLEEGKRIYKGEGTLEFIAYNPFGYCTNESYDLTEEGAQTISDKENWQVTDTYVPFGIKDDNIQEWNWDAGLKSEDDYINYNTFEILKEDQYTYNKAYFYNPGDRATDFELYITPNQNVTEDLKFTIEIGHGDSIIDYLFVFSVKGLKEKDSIILNTKNHTLKVFTYIGAEGKKYESNLRYDLVKSTNFPKIPRGEGYIKIKSSFENPKVAIKYSYIFY